MGLTCKKFVQAAEGQAAVLQAQMKSRGCREEFVPDAVLLQEGKVRPLPLSP